VSVLKKGQILTDYYAILLRATAALDPGAVAARNALYDRARRMQVERLRGERPPLHPSAIDAERAALEAAIDRVEAEVAHRDSIAIRNAQVRRDTPQLEPNVHWHRDAPQRISKRLRVFALLSALGAILLLSLGIVTYTHLRGQSTGGSGTQANLGNGTGGNREAPRSGDTIIDVGEVEPGVDGGSSDAGLPYPYRRQAVYYRTIYSVGMLVVDRSQRFLYLVQPQITALRYGIGVGGECSDTSGLYRISRKEEWPEWVPSPELLKRRSYPKSMAGGPGNPLGARGLYIDSGVEIHGTNAPKTIGHPVSVGCLRMVNDDVVDLYNRVPTATAVVMMN
jgi:lipoprotein-anchoring transpeptidase ErfK/SrfK